jgi:glycosyltransferase involved in cell wall biosynthesis
MMPEYHPRWVVEAIRTRAAVLHPGVDLPAPPPRTPRSPGAPPLVVWNHRWEFDKNPGAFFAAIDAALGRGLDLRLALLGENFQVVPKEFEAARDRYGDRIVQYGWVESRAEYLGWLGRGDIVVSTAEQENFGMAVVEAIRMGCRPLLPRRLSYPEILPERVHAACLYEDQDDLLGRLSGSLSGTLPGIDYGDLAESMDRYAWPRVIGDFDRALDVISRGHS